ncbi:hypothetical protein CCACVL1_14768 [Corchorus capsularis]|uniref:Uncharacterized protein n=1 Tax=Corchorus capsularis TaxID=210143 RepID=A0A1R3I5K9_COCAP|nr:hypothetical protein CCACVL1_14768 [Corchorus capsularis]
MAPVPADIMWSEYIWFESSDF